MQTIVCPSCGTEATISHLAWSADEFCEQCDFPLFWAPGAYEASVAPPPVEEEPAVVPVAPPRRCPTCDHGNLEDARYCNACGAPLDIDSQFSVLQPPEPVELPDRDRYNHSLIAALAAAAVLLVALIVCLT